ncbi:MAG: hypothetical protein QGF62_06835 [Gammaproteobacteria bacterium]|nr:hypothetical protein [Gammaproteobacteria bacterium]
MIQQTVLRLVCVSLLMLLIPPAVADGLSDASRLLRVTSAGELFEETANQQTRDIIRTYVSIVNMSVQITLPDQIRDDIAECYRIMYAWEKFEPGIAQLLADNLSQHELRLLIDFYRNRGLPPAEIQAFKSTIAKADDIQLLISDYLFANSGGCVAQDTRSILSYINQK